MSAVDTPSVMSQHQRIRARAQDLQSSLALASYYYWYPVNAGCIAFRYGDLKWIDRECATHTVVATPSAEWLVNSQGWVGPIRCCARIRAGIAAMMSGRC